MAGIGFELRKLLKRDSFFSILQTYAYAGIISSGPWVLSIIAVLIIGIISIPVVIPRVLVSQFQVSITYLIALSLIFTGFVQLAFTRYSADRIFEKEHFRLLPNLNGLLLLVTVIGGTMAFPLAILLSGLKAYKAILINFAIGYGTALFLAFFMRTWKLEGLLLAFLIGQFILFKGMLLVIFRNYPAQSFIEFDFLSRNRVFVSLL